MKSLLVDVDEVLADFQTPMFQALKDLYDRWECAENCEVWDCFSLMKPHEKKGLYAVIERPGWCYALKPKPGAQDFIRGMRLCMDVCAVTSHFPSSPTWVHERDNWLKDLFGFDQKHIVHTSAKWRVDGDAFLDDNPSHVTEWHAKRPNALAMLWHIPNTRKLPYDDLRVKSWDEVLERLRAHDLLV